MLETLQTRTMALTHQGHWHDKSAGADAPAVAIIPKYRRVGFQPPDSISTARASGIAIGVSRALMKTRSSFLVRVSGSTIT